MKKILVCWIDGVDTNESVALWNSTEILAAIPKTDEGRLHSCYIYNKLNETEKCSKWVYNSKYRSSSRGIEWNFVCDNRWKGAITQNVYMLGVLTGAVVLGGLADKYGRKTIFCTSGVLQLVFGVLAAFIPEYWSFLIVQFFYAMFGSAGSFITGFVLTIEIIGANKRTIFGVAFQCAFSLGIMLVAAWGALIDNRQILQVVYGLHGALLIPHIWIMNESPRWLWARGHVKEAVDIVQKGLKFNGSIEVLDKTQIFTSVKTKKLKKVGDSLHVTTLDLFRSPNLRNRTINVCFCWFANSLVYYGLILNTGKMEGNPYLIIAILGLLELPSYGAVIYFLDIYGRRPLISSMMLCGGTACVIAAYIPSESILATATVVLGKLFITGSFAIIYNYSAELFPTVLRNSALGLGSMCARVSGALTPLISLLDSFNPKIPTVIFGAIALLSGLLTLLLPETMDQPMPQSIADGEMFGKEDSCLRSFFKKKKSKRYSTQDETSDTMIPLEQRCWIEGVDTNESVAAWNSSEILVAIPTTPDGRLHNCYMFNEFNETEKCSKWVFDSKYRSSSRAIEWNFVCDNRWMGAIAQTVYMLGVFTGAVVLGGMADRYGRKLIFCWSGVLQLFFGVIVAFIPEYWSFLAVQYLYAIFGSAGSYITGFVLTMEVVGANKRTICGVTFQCAFALGIMLVAGWGALIDDRQILQVIYGLHGLLLIPHIWIMDESPRWLWAQGRAKEAVDIIQKGLKFNRSQEVLDREELVSKGKVEKIKDIDVPTATTLDLFKTPNLRIKTINVCFCWFANSLVYYGLTLSTGKIEGNPYLITAIFGFVELPSYAAIIYFLDIWGRRPLISSMMLIGGTACIVAAYLQSGSTVSTTVVIAGKLFIAGSFAIIYNYSAELFPTVVRNSALGLGSMCARFSGALTPLISLLDSFDPKIPAVIFGVIALISGFLTLFLPETTDQPMPQSLSDGELFGKGDTCFSSCFGKKRNTRYSVEDKTPETMVPLEDMTKKA